MFQSVGKFHTAVGGISKPKASIYSEGGGDFSGLTPFFLKRLYTFFYTYLGYLKSHPKK